MRRLSSMWTRPFRFFTLTSLRRLAAARRGTTAAIISGPWRRNAENRSETVQESASVTQRFLAESTWYDDTVIGPLQEYLGPRLGPAEAVTLADTLLEIPAYVGGAGGV